jgi:hypothetical protein
MQFSIFVNSLTEYCFFFGRPLEHVSAMGSRGRLCRVAAWNKNH